MKWLAIKTALKKGWVWIKAHAWLPIMVLLAIVGLLLYALTRNAAFMSAVIDAFEGQRESYKKEMETLNDIHKKEAEEKKKVLEAYNENLKALEEEYAGRNESLSSEKKKELKKLIDESYNNPEKLSRELARLYGLEHG